MFPTNKNILIPGISFHHISHTNRIIAITGRIDSQTQVRSKRLNCIIWALTLAAFSEIYSAAWPREVGIASDAGFRDWTYHFQVPVP